jgi:hypothetical protein
MICSLTKQNHMVVSFFRFVTMLMVQDACVIWHQTEVSIYQILYPKITYQSLQYWSSVNCFDEDHSKSNDSSYLFKMWHFASAQSFSPFSAVEKCADYERIVCHFAWWWFVVLHVCCVDMKGLVFVLSRLWLVLLGKVTCDTCVMPAMNGIDV